MTPPSDPVTAPPASARPPITDAGTPYHRLARTSAHRWWRPPVGTVTVLVLLLLAQFCLTGLFLAGAFVAGRPTGDTGVPVLPESADVALVLLAIGSGLPAVLVTTRLVQRRRPGTVSSVAGRLRWSWLGRCLLLAAPAVAMLLVGGYGLISLTTADADAGGGPAGGPSWVGLAPFLGSALLLTVLVPIQAAAEEYLFRGWLVQALGAYLRSPWLIVAVQAVPFAATHGWGTTWGFVDLLVFALVTGWLTIRTGGLEAAIALHVTNNLAGMLLAAAVGQLDLNDTAADAPWQFLAVDVAVLIGYAALVSWLAGRGRVRRVADTGTRPADLPPSPGHRDRHTAETVLPAAAR
ncbi:CPBP family intramembrane glutamic endopeptidase [Solwaraspora sp. WMMB335]|uniref:CPBP family intramembrane glutamic endopeptidase n=1 Tax=Solwaraspora sp. WMMB335 TaxID=3404118 RepID=UPI003B92DD43